MRTEFTLYGRGGGRRDVVVTGHPAATWAQALAGNTHAGDGVFRGADLIDLSAPLGSGVIANGDVLSVGQALTPQAWPRENMCLAVVGGSAAGTLLPVGPGEHTVGRGTPSNLVIDDRTVSTRHATLRISATGEVRLTDLGSTNGTFVGSRRLGAKDSATVAPGERFVLGQAVVMLLEPSDPNGSVTLGADGARSFNRVLRYDSVRRAEPIEIPPQRGDFDSGSSWAQYVASASMLIAGVGSAVAFDNYLYAALGAVGPVVLMGTSAAVERRTRLRNRRDEKELEERRSQARTSIAAAAAEESASLWSETLDPARAVLAGIGPTSDLWSVDAIDPRALTVRVGTCDRPASLEIRAGTGDTAEPPTLVAAPVTVDLRATPVLGIAGDPAEVRGVARAIVHQVAASRSPDDLYIYHLSDGDAAAEWSWLRWLPHTRGAFETVHTVSPSSAALKARLDELTALIDHRRKARDLDGRDRLQLPEVLVVLEGAGGLRTRNAVVTLLQEAANVGVAVLALDTHASRLPQEAGARLLADGSRSVLEVKGSAPVTDVSVDAVSVRIAERTARAMAPLQPLGGRDESELPRSVRFADLMGLTEARESQILLGWSQGREGEAVLGVDEHGNTCAVNLVTQGPHALVAGTSGSGKSELLRTLITGLALSASPEDLALLLVDYKGGGAFGKLESLPHVVGYADDLLIGGVLAGRLLESLKAELDLRKALFKSAGNAEGLKEYRKARSRGDADLPPIARLVIVVDEFAELKEAQPEFVDGLVNVARVGRSLGVHLVLATQQPAGVVTAQIRDNANLRICLRVLDTGTSTDIVGTPLAGTFSNRDKGRAVLVSGDAPPLVLQTAYVSAPVRDSDAETVPAPDLHTLPWAQCGSEPVADPRAEEETGVETDLSRLVSLLRDCAQQRGMTESRRPWQPPLPDRVPLSTLDGLGGPDAPPLYGVEDHPRQQKHSALAFTLGGGNLGIAGGRASGRSTALRSLAVALTGRLGADDLHIHVIDQSPVSTLRALSSLPNTGVVASRSERHVTERLVVRLREELAARSAMLARRGMGSLRELRAAGGDTPPWIVVLVDGWDALVAGGGNDALRDAIIRLADEGPSLGIQFAVTGGKALSTSRLLTTFQDLLVLRFDQRDDMTSFSVPVGALPDEIPPGRAFRPGSSDAIQIAILDGKPDTDSQNEALRRFAAGRAAPVRHTPMRIAELPSRISLAEARLRPGSVHAAPRAVIVAVGGDDVACRIVDLDSLRTPFVVAGPQGSGRTTALAVMAAQLWDRGFPVHCWHVSPRDQHLFPDGAVTADAPEGPFADGTVILVDDAHELDGMDPAMIAYLEDPAVRLCVAGAAGDAAGLSGFSGWKTRLRSGATGLLLSPQFREGEIIGATIGMEEAFSGGPGRAYFGSRGLIELVQIPVLQ